MAWSKTASVWRLAVRPRRLATLLGMALALSVALGTTDAAPVRGYLAEEEVPSSLAELPPPPAPGTAAEALDLEIAGRSFALRDTPRWALAIADADLSFPHAASVYACALGVAVTPADTPRLYELLQRSQRDLSAATRSAKTHYQRQRPFLINGQPICTPAEVRSLAAEGSYPSGHTTTGWGWALVLAEVAADRTDALMVRARSVGESRNVCNVHWHSDVVQGRSLAAAVVARLHASADFRADVEAARREIAAARARQGGPGVDCAAESAALSSGPALAP